MQKAETSSTTQTEVAAAWVLRRVGFGATSADLDHATSIGLEAFLAELFEPDLNGIGVSPDPFSGVDLALRTNSPADVRDTILAWFNQMTSPVRPISEWTTWFWHGHLVSSISIVKSPLGMANQIRLFRELGTGVLRPLLRAITIDPAMLRYLDGNRNTGANPNENYSRELLELFALGVGNYTEADVLAGASALSGWRLTRNSAEATFVPRRHSDEPQSYLGTAGVHDVETAIDAVVNHPACATFITRSLATAILGPEAAKAVEAVEAETFAESGLEIGPLVKRLVQRGLAGTWDPLAIPPVPWLAFAIRATKADVGRRALVNLLRSSGQVPLAPPNVSGWPTGDAWFSSSATAARLEAARVIAEATPRHSEPLLAATDRDLERLARALGRPEGFTPSTADALRNSDTDGRALLTLALSAPDLVIS